MTVSFCLNQPIQNPNWSQEEIAKANKAFDLTLRVEALMKGHMTRLIQSSLLHVKFPELIPKFRILYPVPPDSTETMFLIFIRKLNQEILSLHTDKEAEIPRELAKKIRGVFELAQSPHLYQFNFTEFLQLKKFLHFTHQSLLNSSLKLVIAAALWKDKVPEDPAKCAADVLAALELSDLKETLIALLEYKPLFSPLEEIAVAMAQSRQEDPLLNEKVGPAIDKVVKLKADFVAGEEIYTEILDAKALKNQYLAPPSIILDTYCFMSLSDPAYKSEAEKYMAKVVQVMKKESDQNGCVLM